jgi:hypothetical protein
VSASVAKNTSSVSEASLDAVVDAAVMLGLPRQKPRAKHRRQRQGDDDRNGYGRRDGDREFAKQPPDDAPHEQQGYEHGDE